MSERRSCKLVDLDRSSYRYERRADRNAHLRQELLSLARQKWRYGYRRLHALLVRRGHRTSPQRLYRLYKEGHLAVRRIRRKRLTRPAMAPLRLCCANQEWALEQIIERRGVPQAIRCDNGSEFAGKALDAWAVLRGVKLTFIRPGKPVENGCT